MVREGFQQTQVNQELSLAETLLKQKEVHDASEDVQDMRDEMQVYGSDNEIYK